jgi:GNAT superfamily N-acetyltransferase
MERERDGYTISTDPGRLDRELIAGFLHDQAYWARGIQREVVDRSIEHSLVFGLYRGERQVGFARAVTDRATFAYLMDVFVVSAEQARGLGAWLIETVLDHPDLEGLRRFLVATETAHSLYERFGFRPLGERAGLFLSIERPAGKLYDR